MSGHVVCASEKTNLRTLHCGWVMSCSLTVLVCVLLQPHTGLEAWGKWKTHLLGLQIQRGCAVQTFVPDIDFNGKSRPQLHISSSALSTSPTLWRYRHPRHIKTQRMLFVWKSRFAFKELADIIDKASHDGLHPQRLFTTLLSSLISRYCFI